MSMHGTKQPSRKLWKKTPGAASVKITKIQQAFADADLPTNPEIQVAKIGKSVILVDAHEWGNVYERVAGEAKLELYLEGVSRYLTAFPNAYAEWNTAMGGMYGHSDLAIPSIKSHHERYYHHILAKDKKRATEGALSLLQKPPQTPLSLPFPPIDNPKEVKEGGFKRTSVKRPRAPDPRPLPSSRVSEPKQTGPIDHVAPSQPAPNRLDPEVTRLKTDFYHTSLRSSTTVDHLRYQETSNISYKDIEVNIRDTTGAYVLQAPGLGLGYIDNPRDGEQGYRWSENAWLVFFDELRQSNRNMGEHIIDSTTQQLRPCTGRTNRGPLRLTYKGHGTYNIVYTAPDLSEDDPLFYRFPPCIRKRLKSVVFRVPIRDMPVVAAARELANSIEAADGGFGPPLWMGSTVVHASSNEELTCELFTVSERMSHTIRELYDPLLLPVIPKSLEKAVQYTMAGLSDVVFAYSVRGNIHLDASLLNFMVQTNGNPQTLQETISNARIVYAIDLDPKLYRSLETKENKSNEWIGVWLYNILFLSCQLKANVPDAVFNIWINQPVAAGRSLGDVVALTMQTLKSTAVGTNCHWVMRTLWKGPIGDWTFSGDLRKTSSEEDLMRETRELCKHYFISILNREAENSLKPFMARGYVSNDQQNAADRYNMFTVSYSIPSRRYFERRLAGADTPEMKAPLLVDVLFDFLKTSLRDEFPDCMHTRLERGITTEMHIKEDYDSWMGRLDELRAWPR